MKTTGIVRRIDELGRVVIPKELRRTMRIREGEELEVFVAPDDMLVLKKYSALKALAEFSREYADILYGNTGSNCLVCDNDVFIACAVDKNVYLGKRISKALENFLNGRKSARLQKSEVFSLANEGADYADLAISPIICNGDVLGGIILAGRKPSGDDRLKLVEVASLFLAKQFD